MDFVKIKKVFSLLNFILKINFDLQLSWSNCWDIIILIKLFVYVINHKYIKLLGGYNINV